MRVSCLPSIVPPSPEQQSYYPDVSSRAMAIGQIIALHTDPPRPYVVRFRSTGQPDEHPDPQAFLCQINDRESDSYAASRLTTYGHMVLTIVHRQARAGRRRPPIDHCARYSLNRARPDLTIVRGSPNEWREPTTPAEFELQLETLNEMFPGKKHEPYIPVMSELLACVDDAGRVQPFCKFNPRPFGVDVMGILLEATRELGNHPINLQVYNDRIHELGSS